MWDKFDENLYQYKIFWRKNNLDDIIHNLDRRNSKELGYSPVYFNCTIQEYLKDLKEVVQVVSKEKYYAYLNRLIHDKNLTAHEIYSKADISKQQFSKILSGINSGKEYIPNKNWLLKIAFSIELTLNETYVLLRKAGHTFSDCNVSDKVFVFCFEKSIYNTCDIDILLSEFNCPLLFSINE